MMKRMRTIPGWLRVLIVSVVMVGIALGFYFYTSQQRLAITRTQEELAVVAALKVKQITDWRNERLADATVAKDLALVQSGWLEEGLGLNAESIAYLKSIQKEYSFLNILLVDPSDYTAIDIEDNPVELEQPVIDIIDEVLAKNQLIYTEIHVSAQNNHPHIGLAIPYIQAAGGEDRVILLQISTEEFLYSLLQSWPSASATGETLLIQQVGDEVLFLNDLRHVEDAALQLTIPLTEDEVPAIMAVKGITGPVRGIDYRGVPVIAVIAPVPGTDWFMISKMDVSEMNRTWVPRTVTIIIAVTLFALSVILAAAFFWQRDEKRHAIKEVRISQALTESEERFRSYVQNAPDGIFVADQQGNFMDANPAACRAVGVSRKELLEMNVFDLLSEDVIHQAQAYLNALLESGEAAEQIPFETKSGDTRLWTVKAVGLSNDTYLAFTTDITEQNRIFTQLQNLQETFDTALDVTGEGVWEWNVLTDDVFWSQTMEELLGEEGQTHTFASWGDRLHPDDREETIFTLQEHLAGKTPMWQTEYRIQVADGGWIWALGKGKVIERDQAGEPLRMVGTLSDITDLKILQEMVDHRRRQLERILDILPVGIWLANTNGDLIYANSQAESIWGTTQLVSANNYQVFNGWRLPSREKVQPDDWSLLHSIREGVVIEKELLEIEATDGTHRIILTNTAPLYDAQGQIEGGIEVNYDITSLHQAQEEIRALNADLEQRVIERTTQLQAANEEMEAFVYSVSHDLRAPLRAIDGFSHLLADRYQDTLDQEGLRYLKIISQNIVRMNQLIDGLLKLSKVNRVEIDFTTLDMAHLVRQVIHNSLDAWQIMPDQIVFGPLDDASGNAVLVTQVWKNLLDNAVKYSKSPETLKVQISSRVEEAFVVYSVEDNGIGFDNQHAEQLFGLFERLANHDEVEGIGIGLAIVKRIVKHHGGKVWAHGEKGKGAIFSFTLPMA